MPDYVVEVEAEDAKGAQMLEVKAPSAMAAKAMVERDGYRFIRLRMVGNSKRRDRIESWIGLGAGILIAGGLLVMAALILLYL
jgi:hypothetical protein